MRIALNGYFWDQPRTGSGQYLRHLWCALQKMIAQLPDKDDHDLALLLPDNEAVLSSATTWSQIDQSKIQNPKLALERSEGSKVKKTAWEQLGAPRQARRVHADLLHVPYLAAPVRKGLPIVVTAHDVIPW